MDIKFDDKGLLPVIVQDAFSGQVLMQAFMNEQAYQLTLSTQKAHYWSRSRQQLWLKGETSGHFQEVVRMTLDCDGDCLLLQVKQVGAACHTGEYSCFHHLVKEFENVADAQILFEDRKTILDRVAHPEEGSYTNYLWNKGVDKICKKIGEEASEVIIASKNNDPSEISCEIADLLFHLQVLMAKEGLDWKDVFGVLKERAASKRVREWKS